MSAWRGLLRQDQFIDQCTRALPPALKQAALARHQRTRQAHAGAIYDGTRDANIELRQHAERFDDKIPLFTQADELRAWARTRAEQTARQMSRNGVNLGAAYALGARIVRRFGLQPPQPSEQRPLQACVLRMRCERWWRRKARQHVVRAIEAQARILGRVHKRAGCYVSHYTLRLWQAQQRRNRAILAECEAVNEQEQVFTLAELADKSVANPALRRNELMVRLAGTEQYANAHGDTAVFITLTAPGYMHAVHSRTGAVNAAAAEHDPRRIHAYLRQLWSQARATLDRLGISYYGIRVAEPHHDGTPHWHLLVFAQPGEPLRQVVETLRDYAFRDAPDEPGARKHRFKAEAIDPTKGTATGYVAKYIAKNVDGAHVGTGLTRGSEGEWLQSAEAPTTLAERVRAWASTWGIRQFQFFGQPSVSVWRELRRLDTIRGHADAEALRQAADTGDWCTYLTLMGGPAARLKQRPAALEYVDTGQQGLYREPLRKPLLRVNDVVYDTRPHEWRVRYKPSQQQPDPVYVTGSAAVNGPVTLNGAHAGHDNGRPRHPLKAPVSLKGNPSQPQRLKASFQTLKAVATASDTHLPRLDAPFKDDAPPIPHHVVGALTDEWRELEELLIEVCGPDWRTQRLPISQPPHNSPSLEFCQ